MTYNTVHGSLFTFQWMAFVSQFLLKMATPCFYQFCALVLFVERLSVPVAIVGVAVVVVVAGAVVERDSSRTGVPVGITSTCHVLSLSFWSRGDTIRLLTSNCICVITGAFVVDALFLEGFSINLKCFTNLKNLRLGLGLMEYNCIGESESFGRRILEF
ncbi:hypothetical protein Tco_0267096 [Tanacetum coccineum]